jgi:hypothetical protein
MRRGQLARVQRLEAHAAAHADRARAPETAADWLTAFERLGRQGFFDEEPDFSVALAAYREAVAAAGPGGKGLREWEWLAEMYQRVRQGRPPVTEAEFRGLEGWFRQNEHRLPFNRCVDLGGGRRVSVTNLRCDLQRGPRASGATQVVEDLRALRTVLGERPASEGSGRDPGEARALFAIGRREPGGAACVT